MCHIFKQYFNCLHFCSVQFCIMIRRPYNLYCVGADIKIMLNQCIMISRMDMMLQAFAFKLIRKLIVLLPCVTRDGKEPSLSVFGLVWFYVVYDSV